MSILSSLPPRAIMIHDVKSCYMCKMGEVGDYEIHLAYKKLCDGVLKDEFKIFEKEGLTCALYFIINFKIEWIRTILSTIHDMELWLENWPVKITKNIIHFVTRFQTFDKNKTI